MKRPASPPVAPCRPARKLKSAIKPIGQTRRTFLKRSTQSLIALGVASQALVEDAGAYPVPSPSGNLSRHNYEYGLICVTDPGPATITAPPGAASPEESPLPDAPTNKDVPSEGLIKIGGGGSPARATWIRRMAGVVDTSTDFVVFMALRGTGPERVRRKVDVFPLSGPQYTPPSTSPVAGSAEDLVQKAMSNDSNFYFNDSDVQTSFSVDGSYSVYLNNDADDGDNPWADTIYKKPDKNYPESAYSVWEWQLLPPGYYPAIYPPDENDDSDNRFDDNAGNTDKTLTTGTISTTRYAVDRSLIYPMWPGTAPKLGPNITWSPAPVMIEDAPPAHRDASGNDLENYSLVSAGAVIPVSAVIATGQIVPMDKVTSGFSFTGGGSSSPGSSGGIGGSGSLSYNFSAESTARPPLRPSLRWSFRLVHRMINVDTGAPLSSWQDLGDVPYPYNLTPTGASPSGS